jgi:hypothetical protein
MLKVLSVKNCTLPADTINEYAEADYEIQLENLRNNQVVTIYLPKRYFEPLQFSNGDIAVQGQKIENGEIYTCDFSTFKDTYNKDVYCYSIECDKKNFNLYYDEQFNELL